jgi:hypothetical protein
MMAIVLLPKIDFSCRFVIYKLFIYMCVCAPHKVSRGRPATSGLLRVFRVNTRVSASTP